MRLRNYFIDKILSVIIFGLSYFIILMMLIAFRVGNDLKIAVTVVFVCMGAAVFLTDFCRKRRFYDELTGNIELLDKKYLVLETVSKPTFYEGEILYRILYESNKSMIENISKYERNIEDFKEYVEMWIHEVKVPVSSLTLMCHNHGDILDRALLEQVRKLNNYTEQILYYVRSNYSEQDFSIKKTPVDVIVGNVALKNKDDLLGNNIDLNVNLNDVSVYTDSKWLEFILNQIINNSIKYRRENVESYIRIYAVEHTDMVALCIDDNGIGIPKEDLPYVFKKSFTGENGRTGTKSTGMGLYIADKLCKKLGHKIEIESTHGVGTGVKIIFGINGFYDVTKL